MSDQPTEPDDQQTDKPRGGNGRYTRSLETAERDAEAARLRGRSMSYRAIADAMGYESHTSAMDAVKRALDAAPAEAAPEVRKMELGKLDHMETIVLGVLERLHVTVSNGNVMRLDGQPLQDDGPVLAAVDRLVKIQDRRSKLLGLDAPVKADIGGKLTYEIVGVNEGEL